MITLEDMGVYTRPESQRIWVVRADGGEFLPNFRQASVVAIGHLDALKLELSKDKPFYPDKDSLAERMFAAYKKDDQPKATFTNHLHQVESFIFEMQVGDLVLTPSEPWKNVVQVGRIIGKPRLDDERVTVVRDMATGRATVMGHHLRRKVKWGPVIDRKRVPDKVNRAFKANQTVFCLDDHWESVYHSLYPIFMSGDDFHFSIKMNTQSDINNLDIMALLTYLSEAEAFAKSINQISDYTSDDFEKTFDSLYENEELNLATKAQYMSPGDVWGILQLFPDPTLIAAYYIAYSSLFGSSKLGWDGLLDKDIRHKIAGFVGDRIDDWRLDRARSKLKVQKPTENTKALEDASDDEVN